MGGVWIFVADEAWPAALELARAAGGTVTAAVVGPQPLADAVAAAGVPVVWVEPAQGTPSEAYAVGLAAQVAAASPDLLVSSGGPAARTLLGAAAAAAGASLVPGVLAVTDGPRWTVRRSVLGGEAIETVTAPAPLAVILAADEATDRPPATGDVPGTVAKADTAAAAMAVAGTQPAPPASGIVDARTVVSFGRGVHAKADVALVERLAQALGAEVGCSMPVADDLGWLDRSRYVGRSGQHISPRLYLAVGISGAPQHLEGVRGARVVAAINNDPKARIFRRADYGAVGDLYEVVPALIAALQQ